MRPTWLTRARRVTLVLTLVTGAIGPAIAAAKPYRPKRPRAVNLFSVTGLVYQVNRVQCGFYFGGPVCADPSGSPVNEAGFWPKGTPDAYIFQAGLQLAAVVPTTAVFGGPGRSWAGDTIGAYFVDLSGGQEAGEGFAPNCPRCSQIFNALDAADAAAWPANAQVRDTSIFNRVLLPFLDDPTKSPLKTISQGDAWVRYWEGNPARLTGRPHPMGIAVDQRVLAWNFPTGNEDIIYVTFTFYNVTARGDVPEGRAKYDRIQGIPDTKLQDSIADIGTQFQKINEQKFNVEIPDTGYTIQSMFAGFAADMDVANFDLNFATAILPFSIGAIYMGSWLPDVGWILPADIFGPPFASAPGFAAAKYLKAPSPVGLTMFSQQFNPNVGFGLLDPDGVNQLYRYFSGFFGGSDAACSVGTPPEARRLRLCYLGAVPGDARFYQASGPLDLNPGEARTIVVAIILAAPVNTPDLVIGQNLPGGFPATGDSIFKDPSAVRPIERIAGWVSQSDTSGNGVIEQNEVTTVPRSLLNKALVAQTVFNNGFLLPFAPDAPQFFLVPGDNQVTVVWQKSVSEQTGDPFYAVASQPGGLFDPNFRQFDVEGYRIYRGRTSSSLQFVAQFDYAGTFIADFTGAFDYGSDCAPELGVVTGCPVAFDTVPFIDVNTSPHEDHPLSGDVVQVGLGNRVQLADTSVLILKADTAVINTQCANIKCPPLKDTGVPFSFVDRDVRNSFTYFYAVTAFDVNSLFSTPTSIESPRVTKQVTPRVASGQDVGAAEGPLRLIGGDGSVLDPAAPLPTIAPATGIFSGPMPATNGVDVALSAFLPQLLGSSATLDVTIDSVIPGMAELDVQAGSFQPIIYHLTAQVGGAPKPFSVALSIDRFTADESASAPFEATALDSAKSARFGGDQTFSLYGVGEVRTSGVWRLTSFGRAAINEDPLGSDRNGPRWWAGAANENTPDPNGLVCAPADGGCAQPDLSRNAGSIAGVGIFHLQSYTTIPNAPGRNIEGLLATVNRAADFRVYWGTAGVVDSVVDVTHRVPVRFSPKIRASWGILTQASFAGTNPSLTRDGNNSLLTWSDVYCVDPVPRFLPATVGASISANCGGVAQVPAALQNTATLSPIAFQSSSYNGTAALAENGNGFIFYLNGHFFLMRMAALPAANDVWNARFYAGTVTGSAAAGDFAFTGAIRPPAVPGLRITRGYQGSTLDVKLATDLSRVHTVPDPYYVANALELTTNSKILKIVNLPAQCIIRIYSVSGLLVAVIPFNEATGGGEATWNLRNRNNQFVASGVYFYHIETPAGQSKVGRFTIVNFAP